jgi:pyruvate/2-oxoglutarate dehydrogenase complex dihydrolipoamide acyltransferase (E2) component
MPAAAEARGGRGRGGDSGLGRSSQARSARKDVPIDIRSDRKRRSSDDISVRSQVTGQLQEASFHEGDFVKQGQQLFTLDRRPFEAALAQAEANVVARPGAARAGGSPADARRLERRVSAAHGGTQASSLTQRGIISKDQAEQTRAQADATAALVKADRAAIDSARPSSSPAEAAVVPHACQLGYTSQSVADRRPHGQPRGESSAPRHREQHRADDHRGDAAGVRHVHRSGRAPRHHQKAHLGKDGCRDRRAAGRRDQTGVRRAHRSSTTPSTDDRHDQAEGDVRNADRRLWPGQFSRA